MGGAAEGGTWSLLLGPAAGALLLVLQSCTVSSAPPARTSGKQGGELRHFHWYPDREVDGVF